MINLTNSKMLDIRTAELAAGVVIENSYILKRVASPTNPHLSAVDRAVGAANEDLVGIALVSPIAATSRSVVDEQHSRGSGNVITLNNPGYVAGTMRIFNATTDAVVTGGTITSIASNGTVTLNAGDPNYPAPSDVLLISYRRSIALSELSQEGLPIDFANRVNGQNGAVEFVTAKATIETDLFDTSVAYTIGAKVYPDANGIPTATASVGGIAIGTVAVVPSAEYPALGIAIDANF